MRPFYTEALVNVSKKKEPAATLTSESLAEQIEAFLASGKKIEKVPNGVSGMSNTANKHITISSKKA